MSNSYPKMLTKTDYMMGLKCPSLLWMSKYQKQTFPQPDESTKNLFETGDIVGNYAKTLFPKGIEIKWQDFKNAAKETLKAINTRKPIFEAVIMTGRFYSRPDILSPAPEDRWDINEVKSSSKVKDEHIADLSFQKYVYELSGLKINKCFLIHVNSDYVKNGEIDPKKLLVKEEITKEVIKASEGIKERIEPMLKVISQEVRPTHKISPSCSNPYECPLMDDCWEIVPEYSVFNFYKMGQTAFELFENGIVDIKDVPSDYKLTEHQNIQKTCEHTGKPHINKEKIKEFISKLKYPLYFMDFETLGLAVPVFDGTSPFQQVPFQFSVHLIEKEGDSPKHFSFLAKGDKDPREDFLKALKNSLSKEGTILVYYESFEKRILAELAKAFPKYEEWTKETNKRIMDLILPFRNFYYYDAKQKGSASIKDVLPALTGKSYEAMAIGNGEIATLRFYQMVKHHLKDKKLKEDEISKIQKDLEDYCGLDTEGMVWILNKLISSI